MLVDSDIVILFQLGFQFFMLLSVVFVVLKLVLFGVILLCIGRFQECVLMLDCVGLFSRKLISFLLFLLFGLFCISLMVQGSVSVLCLFLLFVGQKILMFGLCVICDRFICRLLLVMYSLFLLISVVSLLVEVDGLMLLVCSLFRYVKLVFLLLRLWNVCSIIVVLLFV